MATIPAITRTIEVRADGSPEDAWRVPGPSEGLVQRVREVAGGYVGPQFSPGTAQERVIVEEKAASGPRNVVFPWFLPYHDSTTLHESAVMRLAYRQMLKSPIVKSAILGKLFGVAGLTLKTLPADKKNPRDKAIAKHVEWMFAERLRDTVPGLIWSILIGALIDGYSVCEKVWVLEDRGRYAGKYSLAKLKPKDTNNDLVLQTDEFRNVVGVLGLRYNGGREFSPANFLIYRHLPLFDNPTGFSDCASAYAAYWMLDTVTKLRAIAAEKYAIPMLWGSYQNTTVKTSLENALKKAKSQRWFSVPEQCRVQALEMAGASEEHFRSFRADLVHEVYLGIQYAVLQQLEGDTTDGRGNSQVHQSSAEKAARFLANSVEAVLNDRDCGLIKDCVDLNYVVAEYPKAKLSAVDVNEMVQEVQIDAVLHQLVDLSRDELYERYGRTPPEDDDDIIPAATPPQPPGGTSPAPGGGGDHKSLPFADFDSFEKLLLPKEVAALPFDDSAKDGNVISLPQAEDDTALAGADGRKVAQLLRASVKQGAATLGTLTEDAVKRLLADPRQARRATELFTEEEREQLAQALAATNATAELLGRARIRKRLEQVEKNAEKFSEHATDFSCFDEKPIHPLAPRRALDWFKRLIPGLRPDSQRFEHEQKQQGFHLAVTTEETLLERIKGIIARVLGTGAGVRAAPKTIDYILDDAGLSPQNPQYAEMVFRTNMMSAYNRGSHEEMQDPDVRDSFPVWRYVGIRDGRQGADHEPHFDRYYPNHVSFEEVRGPRAYNCRCSAIPIFYKEWAKLQKRGAHMAKFAERDVSGEARDESGKWTAGGGAPKHAEPAARFSETPATAGVERIVERDADGLIKRIIERPLPLENAP